MTQAAPYPEVIQDEEALACFLQKVREFDQKFCAEMFTGSDFTIRLEVRGNASELLHVRVYADVMSRPPNAQKRIDEKNSR